ncbi:MAG: response regulator, partial [Myxococcales bacterium]|nr:response regulator [Myxococcales bacterium]
MPNARHVLVVDDGPAILEMLERNLERHGYVVHTAATGTDALTIIRDGFNGVVLLDLNLPDYRALELFTELRKLNDLIPVIIITAHGTID